MLDAARKLVPNAKFELVDFRDFAAEEGTFDAVTAYFSMLTSVSQDDIRSMIGKIGAILKKGGFFVFSTASMSCNNAEQRWMGRPVLVSSLSREEVLETIKSKGFEIVYEGKSKFKPKAFEVGICEEEDEWESHLFVYARKV